MFRRIWREVEDLFEKLDETFFRPSWNIEECCLEPLAEVDERENYILVTVDLPCVERKEDVELQVSEDSLTIEAKLARCFKLDRWGTVQRNVEFRRFKKVIKLPSKVEAKGGKAAFRRGILKIFLPKKVERYSVAVE